MEAVKIVILGFPEAGKSTIANTFTGTNYSKIGGTEEQSVFCVGMFDNYTNPESIEDNILNREDIFLQFPNDFQLSKKWNYVISDLTGIDNIKISTDISFRHIDKYKKTYDIYLVVFNVNDFDNEDLIDRNEKLLKKINKRVVESHPCKLFIILNHCDDIEDSIEKENADFDSHKFNDAVKILNREYNYDILGLSAKRSMIMMTGNNGMFDSESDKKKYEALKHNEKNCLQRYGFTRLVTEIEKYINDNTNNLINKHVLIEIDEELEKTNLNLNILDTFINRFKRTDDDSSSKMIDKITKYIMKLIDEQNFNNDDDISNFESQIMQIPNECKNIMDEYLVATLVNDIENYIMEFKNKLEEKLSNTWNVSMMKRIYLKGELSKEKFKHNLNLCSYSDDLLKIIKETSHITKHNVEYLLIVINEYISKNPQFVKQFRYDTGTNKSFGYVCRYINVPECDITPTFEQDQKYNKLFHDLYDLFVILSQKILYVDDISSNDSDISNISK